MGETEGDEVCAASAELSFFGSIEFEGVAVLEGAKGGGR